jgi:mono/diheme cytochrome c family protein
MDQAKSFINPFTPTEEFIASGKKLYEGKGWCAFCHGWEGTGAPSAGRTFPPDIKMPTNFADAAWQAARSDGELFWVLIHGSHGTDMVPYMPQYITDKEAWQIIAYIRTFGGT